MTAVKNYEVTVINYLCGLATCLSLSCQCFVHFLNNLEVLSLLSKLATCLLYFGHEWTATWVTQIGHFVDLTDGTSIHKLVHLVFFTKNIALKCILQDVNLLLLNIQLIDSVCLLPLRFCNLKLSFLSLHDI